jgi:monovalent cation/proton antiporter MnhG/PhaG subunit
VSPKEVVVDVLLGLVVAIQLLCCVGLLVMPTVLDRVHFLTPASSMAPVLLAGAVVTAEALNHQGVESVLIALFMIVFGAVLTHATARAARVSRSQDWRPRQDETVHRP